MAQLDGNMYLRDLYGAPADLAGSFERGMKLGDMIKENKKQSLIADANKSSMVVGPDGKKSLDYGALESKLGEYGLPEEALKAKNQFMQNQTQKMEFDKKRQLYEAEEYAREAFNVSDQASQDAAIARLQAKGLDTSRIPKIYSNDFIAQARREGMSTLERLNYEQKEKDLEARRGQQQFDNNVSLANLKLNQTKAEAEAAKPRLTVGQEAQDKNYGVEHSEFTSVNEKAAVSAIDQLKKYKQMLEDEEKAGFLAAGGGRASSLPDLVRQQKSIEIRDGIRSQANKGLKGTFGGNPTEGERKAAAEEFYNDKLNNKANITLLSGKLTDMEAGLVLQRAKSKYFKDNGTLRGFDGAAQPAPQAPPGITPEQAKAELARRKAQKGSQ